MEIIQTDRLILRDLGEMDWEAVHSYASDLEVVRYMNFGPNTEEDTKKFVQQAIQTQREQPRRNYELAMIFREDHRTTSVVGPSFSCVCAPPPQEEMMLRLLCAEIELLS